MIVGGLKGIDREEVLEEGSPSLAEGKKSKKDLTVLTFYLPSQTAHG